MGRYVTLSKLWRRIYKNAHTCAHVCTHTHTHTHTHIHTICTPVCLFVVVVCVCVCVFLLCFFFFGGGGEKAIVYRSCPIVYQYIVHTCIVCMLLFILLHNLSLLHIIMFNDQIIFWYILYRRRIGSQASLRNMASELASHVHTNTDLLMGADSDRSG